MNRIDRLFNILLILQRRKLVRALDLAQQFEVSKRTVYRDLSALGEMGVPLISMPSEGFALVEGFYMPPLHFTADEAKALLLGTRMLAGQASGELARSAALATEKIAHILPTTTQGEVEQLIEIIHFYLPKEKFDLNHPYLTQLQRALKEQRTVFIRYHSFSQQETTERVLEPHFLTYSDGAWYVNGYCRLREDVRSFRLERIARLDVLKEKFKPRPLVPPPAQHVTVRVRFVGRVVRWVRERQHYTYIQDETVLDNGDTIMLYRMDASSEIQSWLMGWGAQAEVLEPLALRAALREEAQQLVLLLT